MGPGQDPMDSANFPNPCLVCCTSYLQLYLHGEATTIPVLVGQSLDDGELSPL